MQRPRHEVCHNNIWGQLLMPIFYGCRRYQYSFLLDRILFTGLYKPLLMTIVLRGLHVVFKKINVKNELIETKNLAAMVYCFMS